MDFNMNVFNLQKNMGFTRTLKFFKKSKNLVSGFTLLELLVVVAIIGILSSVVMVSLSNTRAKARDSKAINDMNQIQKALILYRDKYSVNPPNVGADEVTKFNNMAQNLINEGFMSSVPVPPSNHTYMYYNYGGNIGGLLVTQLEAALPSTTGYPGTCRPFNFSNWCMDNSAGNNPSGTRDYCLCNPD